MEDHRIIELLIERSEDALGEVSQKYSRLYKMMIRKALSDEFDVEECANDVLLAVWNSIPPNRPKSLAAYVCRIARRIGIDKLRYYKSKKRADEYTVMLSELEDCLSCEEPTYEPEERREELNAVLTNFLRGLDPETEILFVRRYVYLETVSELAERFSLDENHISVKLYRARKMLKKLLEKEDIKL